MRINTGGQRQTHAKSQTWRGVTLINILYLIICDKLNVLWHFCIMNVKMLNEFYNNCLIGLENLNDGITKARA